MDDPQLQILLRPAEDRETIPYLSKSNIEQFADVTLVSIEERQSIRVSRILLACFSDLLMANILALPVECCEEVTILTEFPIAQLNALKQFVTEGLLPQPLKTLASGGTSYPESAMFRALGINMPDIMSAQPSLIKPEDELSIKDENSFNTTSGEEDLFGEPMFEEDDMSSEESYDETSPKSRKSRQASVLDDDNSSDPKPRFIVGFKKFPSNIPIVPRKYSETKRERLSSYQEEYKDFVRVGTFSTLDPAGLLKYELPKPIETYLRHAPSTSKLPRGGGSGRWRCSICNLRCSTDTALRKHRRKYHGFKYYCPTCGKGYIRRIWYNFIRHMYLHDNPSESPTHECICCGYQADVLKRIDLHREAHGPFHNNECTQCPTKLTSYEEYKAHVEEVHNGQWTYRCGICPQMFKSKKEVGAHVNAHHRSKRQKNVMCEICGKAFSNETHLKTHMGSKRCRQFERPVLKCDHCDFETKLQPYLNKHIRTVHEKLPCTICGKLVPKARLKTHMTIFHTEDHAKPFQCKDCGKGFATKTVFQEHTNIHTGARPYQCDLCEKKFASSGNMYMHRRSSHLGYKRTK